MSCSRDNTSSSPPPPRLPSLNCVITPRLPSSSASSPPSPLLPCFIPSSPSLSPSSSPSLPSLPESLSTTPLTSSSSSSSSSPSPASSSKKKRFRWTALSETALMRELRSTSDNPFTKAAGDVFWTSVSNNVVKFSRTGADVSPRAVRARAFSVMEDYRRENTSELKRSGTEEEFTELKHLCEELVECFEQRNEAMREAKEKAQGVRLKQGKDLVKGREMREKALQTLKEKRQRQEGDESGEEDQHVPPQKRIDMKSILARRTDAKEREIRLREKELEFKSQRLAMEEKEQEQKRKEAERERGNESSNRHKHIKH